MWSVCCWFVWYVRYARCVWWDGCVIRVRNVWRMCGVRVLSLCVCVLCVRGVCVCAPCVCAVCEWGVFCVCRACAVYVPRVSVLLLPARVRVGAIAWR